MVITEADCTSGNNGTLYKENGIECFPTLKYVDINDLSDYKGGRDFDKLLDFV